VSDVNRRNITCTGQLTLVVDWPRTILSANLWDPYTAPSERAPKPPSGRLATTMEGGDHPRPDGRSEERPLRKRRRVVISCTECHRRKQKVAK
jgi:hypothetical protein